MPFNSSQRLLLLLLMFSLSLPSYGQLTITRLLCQNRSQPIGIDDAHPELTWEMESQKRNKRQSAYEIQVSTDPKAFSNHIIWESGKVQSDQSVHVRYEGPRPISLTKYFWRVRVWDEAGKSSGWSPIAYWQAGLMAASDWQAKWIEIGYKESPGRPAAMLRKSFEIRKKIKTASAVVTSHGLYQAYLNGNKMGDAYLTPGWTSYAKRLQYQVYDVKDQLHQGKNSLGTLLGNGWYRGNLVWESGKDFFGDKLALLLQINIVYEDGSSETIISDESWKSKPSAILSSEIYHGETVDARKMDPDWLLPAYDDSDWHKVHLAQYDMSNLIATENEPVRKQETFDAMEIITTPEGDQVIDFGQNLVGFVMVDVKGNEGDSLILEHAEVLDKSGNFYTANLRSAKQKNTYILSGNGNEHFEPLFTWQGFRYVRIGGNVKDISAENFKAVALYSDMAKTGDFSTSNSMLNQLQHNIQWGQRGNFLDIPTDCPQRDERLGWTGDAQVFFRTAAYNMNVNPFFTKWMKDVAADQLPDGRVPHVVPNVLGADASASAGWADVATIIPWDMYLLYGDKESLETQYPSMKSWVDFITDNSHKNLWNKGFHFGDWLFYRPDDDTDGRTALTDKYLIAQCFYAHSTQLLINAANVLGKKEDAQAYTNLLAKIKQAFLKEYVTPNGRLVSGSQTAYVLALHFDMLPEELRKQAAERLVANIQNYGYHLTTGFLGTPYLCHVLSRFGYANVAYTLLMQQTYPSWLYPVTQGATTIWERWDGQKPDGSFQNAGMNSFNHYAYGAIGDWMYRELAGINTAENPEEVGYKKIILRPDFDLAIQSDKVKEQYDNESLTEVNAHYKSYYGDILSHWKKTDQQVVYEVNVPVNTSAEIHLPLSAIDQLKESGKPIVQKDGISFADQKDGNWILTVGSGRYHFTLPIEN